MWWCKKIKAIWKSIDDFGSSMTSRNDADTFVDSIMGSKKGEFIESSSNDFSS